MVTVGSFALVSPGREAVARHFLHDSCKIGPGANNGFEIGAHHTGARRTVITYGLQAIFLKYPLI